jgi:xylulokinase
MSYLLGIDLGTSSVKVLLVDESGDIVGRGSTDYQLLTPQPGWAEQDPQAWWKATVKAVRQSLKELKTTGDILGIGISGQMHGTVLLDQGERLLHPAVIWPDQRSSRQVEEIIQRIGGKRLIEMTGSSLATGFQAATIRWFQQEESELWNQVHQVLLPKDYLRWRMTGKIASEASDGAGTLLLDGQKREWSLHILNELQIEPYILPPIQPSLSVAGRLKPEVAAEMGLPSGISVITGAADTASSLLGAGITSPKNILLTISTGGQLVLPTSEFIVDKCGRMHTFCSALEPNSKQAGWYLMGATLSAGQSLRWLRDNIFMMKGENSYQRMTASAENVPIGAYGLIFWPYLLGERSPLMDPKARGMFFGLTIRHRRADLIRSVMEGVIFSLYEAYMVMVEAGIQPERLILAGGGARSQLWQQMVADVFGLPVVKLRIEEQSAFGAALLAGAGLGLFDIAEASQQWAAYDAPTDPDFSNRGKYLGMLSLFRSVYQEFKRQISDRPAAQEEQGT